MTDDGPSTPITTSLIGTLPSGQVTYLLKLARNTALAWCSWLVRSAWANLAPPSETNKLNAAQHQATRPAARRQQRRGSDGRGIGAR